MLKVVKLISYTIPMYGNKRIHPYGSLIVTDGITEKRVSFGCRKDKRGFQLPPGRDYYTFNRKRYSCENTGSLYYPKIEIKAYKEVEYNVK